MKIQVKASAPFSTVEINDKFVVFETPKVVKNWILEMAASAVYCQKTLSESADFLSYSGCRETAENLYYIVNLLQQHIPELPKSDNVINVIDLADGESWVERKLNALDKIIQLVDEAINFCEMVRDVNAVTYLKEVNASLAIERRVMEQLIKNGKADT